MFDSGEMCVKIPNTVITKNATSWESFIIGQFYVDPPPKGAIHAIANGIWSKKNRDITVSKLVGLHTYFVFQTLQRENSSSDKVSGS